jgi:hypothetical protein
MTKRRRRKHRGTQGGRIDRKPKRKPQSRDEARAQMRSRSKGGRGSGRGRGRGQAFQRGARPPSWRSAINRGLIASAVFFAIVVFAFRRPVAEGISLSAVMVLLYIPMGYFMDGIFYRRRQRQAQREREARSG